MGSPYRVDDQTDDSVLSGSAWNEFVDHLTRAGALVHAQGDLSPTEVAAGYRHLLVLMAIGIDEALRTSDPYEPHIAPGNVDTVLKWGMDCPDAAYLGTSIRGDAAYRIRGNRGTVRYLGLQVMSGMETAANVVADDLELDADGNFTLWLCDGPRDGNWLPLRQGASSLIVRQFFYDWLTEEPARLEIECVEHPPRATDLRLPPPPAGLGRQLGALGEFVVSSLDFWLTMQRELVGQANNAFRQPSARTDIGGAAENVTVWGSWHLEEGEALLIEVTPPEALYWSITLGNHWWESIDYANHQASLNGHQSVVDDNGVFRAVISHDDPGVHNWLDPAGFSRGPMIVRWLRAAEAPVPKTTLLRADELALVLPPSTVRVDEGERRRMLADRRTGVRRRFSR